jgi:nitronate monooxygenase
MLGSGLDMDGIIRTIIEEGVKVVETAGRAVPKETMAKFKEAGIIVMHKCTSIRHALSAQKGGVDVISMDGFDCGGHPGEDDVGNWVLLPLAARRLDIPFIASGGCADGKQLAAALALGACGMNMGTRFMATKEAPIVDGIKNALVEADERSTTHIFRSMGNTERVFKNPVVTKIQELEREFPGDFKKIANLVKGENYRKAFQEHGDPTDSAWSCGQSIGLIEDNPTCKELLSDIVSEAEQILNQGASFVTHSRL